MKAHYVRMNIHSQSAVHFLSNKCKRNGFYTIVSSVCRSAYRYLKAKNTFICGGEGLIKDSIIQKVKDATFVSVPITESSHLYIDLGFDSLSFITLLTEIERAYAITIDIAEMQMCLQVGRLIEIVENKVKERSDSND